jgi:hypothetical protein
MGMVTDGPACALSLSKRFLSPFDKLRAHQPKLTEFSP